MSPEILFYDVSIQSSVRSNKCFSPNTLYAHPLNSRHTQLSTDAMILSPVRYALNYKKLPYKTVWVEFHEIEPVAKKVGAKPTRIKPNGWVLLLTLFAMK